MLGIRQPEIYGHATYQDLVSMVQAEAEKLSVDVDFFQSNHEGDLISAMQQAYLDDVDGIYVLNVEAAKVFNDNNYAIRIINIPADKLDTEITARPYFTYECEGELITVYGEEQVASYNGVLG